MTKTIDEIMTFIDDYYNKQLSISRVSQQRELLITFAKKWCLPIDELSDADIESDVDRFLKGDL